MELLVIAFMVAWAARHWWDGRKSDYKDTDNDYRSRVRGASQRRAGQRYATGWGLYQLRHGWGPMVQDVRDGWRDAGEAKRDWQDDDDDRPSVWGAWRDGWRRAKTAGQETADPPREDPIDAEPVPCPERVLDYAGPADPLDAPATPDTNGGTMTTPTIEINTLDDYRRLLNEEITAATERLEAAARDQADAAGDIMRFDGANASLSAAGLGARTTGGLAELLESAQARRRRASDAVAGAERDLASARHLLAELTATGQDVVQEATNSATEVAHDTGFYARQ